MDRFRAMHKNNPSRLSPFSKMKEKSKIARANKRNELFLNSRTIALEMNSPPDYTEEKPDQAIAETKSHKELYLERFIAWKQEKAKQLEAQKSITRAKPFVSAVSNSNMKRTLAPENHVFKAPKNLKDPTKQLISKPNLRSQKTKISTENFIFAEPKPKPKPKMKPPSISTTKVFVKNINTNVKTHQLQNKQKLTSVKPIPSGNISKTSIKINKPQQDNLSKPYIKPKRTNDTITNAKLKTKKVPDLKIDCNLLNVPFSGPKCLIAETPTDQNSNFDPFSKFITSTKRKSSLKKDINSFTQLVSPIDFENNENKNCFSNKKKKKSLKENVGLVQKNENIYSESPKNHVYNPERFKFVRCSNVKTPKAYRKSINRFAVDPKVDSENKVPNILTSDENQLAHVFDLNTTPISSFDIRPLNYVSPFQSITQSKSNNKGKKESVCENKESDTKVSLELKRTMEMVTYYRKQLKDETTRLIDFCDQWNKYKDINLLILDENSVEMIDVVIGQTKLLTSKKFEQFRGLIDKCEQGAIERKNGEVLKQVDAMPILCGDLEGFWSMVYIQVENLDKRFENLNRWKDNNWTNPDEIKIKSKKILTKVNKIKKNVNQKPVRVNSALKAIMRQVHENFRKNKETDNGCKIDKLVQIVTPERRRSRVKMMLLDSPKLKPYVSSAQKSLNLLKSVLVTEQDKVLSPYKMKTPKNGKKPRNSSLMSFNTEEGSDLNQSKINNFLEHKNYKIEEDKECLFYQLRGRSVKLRNESEIEIPK